MPLPPGTAARVEAMFHAALELSASDRVAFVEASCAADAALRDRVLRLLAAHEDAGEAFWRMTIP